MTRFILPLLALVVGCSDAGGYVEANDEETTPRGVSDAKPVEDEPTETTETETTVVDDFEQPEAPKVYTICADAVAREIEPSLDGLIADALLFWQGEPGAARLRHAPGEVCDVPVRFTDETDWNPKSTALAMATWSGNLPGCKPLRMRIRESRWASVKRDRNAAFLIIHEVGHLVCLPHTDFGIMAPNADLD